MVVDVKSPHILLSVVIPVFNEEESLPHLLGRLLPVLQEIGPHEVIFVNDGSSDDTGRILGGFCALHPGVVKVLSLRINKGKSIALQHGFKVASGDLVLMMDADLQDQPEEISKMIRHMEENNLDVVNGWKFQRHDPISKTMPSRLFNKVMCRFTGIDIHDFNCGLKLMKRECLQGITLYGQLHRFLLVLIANQGYRIGEIPVEHSPRRFGKSKYGTKRLYQGLFDFFTVIFLTRYLRSPLYMFGYYGMICFLVSFILGSYYLFFKPAFGKLLGLHPGALSDTPLWLLSPFLLITGLIFICFGLLGELTYYLHAESHVTRDLESCGGFGNSAGADCCQDPSDE
jgi:dolichol-phosphate mannosyltransferase